MKVFFDTSVLVAGCVRRHPHFQRALPVLASVVAGRDEGVVACHSLAEVYSALTNLPVSPRIQPVEAERMMKANIMRHFRLQPAPSSAYAAAIALCAREGFPGGIVYDALLLECARRANCDRIYTFNLADFRRLAPDLLDRIAAP